MLVDIERDVVAGAAQQLALPDMRELTGDLTDADTLVRIGAELLGVEGERIVTCFEVVEHLSTFVPLLEWSGGLARDGAATFVMSVPNDAFWSIENPFHAGSWSEGAFEELRLLLPPEQTLLRQVALSGSSLVDWQAAPARHNIAIEVGGSSTVATHFIAAFGPRHREVQTAATAAQVDMHDQRRWERQRESNLALSEAMVLEYGAELRKQTAKAEESHAYIQELERQLGRSSSPPASDLHQGNAATESSDDTVSEPTKPLG